MILLDKHIYMGIYDITTNILKDNFYYDGEIIARFHRVFTEVMANEYTIFIDNTDEEFKRHIRYDLLKRRHFTSYFVSYHLHDILVNLLHFSDMELDLFENILPRFVGGYDDKKQRYKRANH